MDIILSMSPVSEINLMNTSSCLLDLSDSHLDNPGSLEIRVSTYISATA